MIIDAHTHVGRNSHIRSSVKELLTSMDKAGIDKSLVFAGMLNNGSNEWMLSEIAPHSDRLLGVAAADAAGEGNNVLNIYNVIEEAKKITDWYGEGKIVACKFYTGYHHYYPQDSLIKDYLLKFDMIGCPAIFHSGDCLNSVKCAKLKYAHPIHIDEVAVDYPNMNFIIAHIGFPWIRDTAEVCYKNDNVYTDISGFVYGDFLWSDTIKFRKIISEFLEIASTEKLLFGSDFPISSQKSYVDICNTIDYINPKELTKNTIKAFKLK